MATDGNSPGDNSSAKKRKPYTRPTITARRKKKKNQQREEETQFSPQPKNLTQLLTLVSNATSKAYSFLKENDINLLPSQTRSLESLLSSSSLSLSKLFSLLRTPPKHTSKSKPPYLSPSSSWFQRFLNSSYDNYDQRWVDCFRMSKASFTLLLRNLWPCLKNSPSGVSPNDMLACALFRLSHGFSFKAVGRRFGIDSETACRVFYEVVKSVNDNLGHLFEFRTNLNRVIVGFGWISLPNCCGALGIHRFNIDGELLGENGSLLVQALVDSEGRFLDVSAGWPSSMKPEMILRQTKLFASVGESKELLDGPMYKLGDGNLIPQYILGDSCFPLLPWLLTPFSRASEEDSFSSSEKAYNSVHSRGMELVAMAFDRVRARWQLFSKRWTEECIETLPFVIVAGCLLHNFLIMCSEPFPDENMGFGKDQELPAYEGEVNESGQRVRDVLASSLSRRFAWKELKLCH